MYVPVGMMCAQVVCMCLWVWCVHRAHKTKNTNNTNTNNTNNNTNNKNIIPQHQHHTESYESRDPGQWHKVSST